MEKILTWLIYFSLGMILVPIFGVVYAHPKTGHTVYKANVNHHDVICDIIEKDKSCYDMHKCHDDNTYICVTNIEISKD